MSQNEEQWRKRLTFAALPGAVSVTFEWATTPDGTSFALRSFDKDGQVIGDGADYDILKARITPLEALAESEGFADGYAKRSMTLNLKRDALDPSW
ncbi:MAG: hypothetical protein AAGI14_10925 [Pseudomonadota bacterium]